MNLAFCRILTATAAALPLFLPGTAALAADDAADSAFFEKKIRPLLVKHCYECHSESNGEQQGGLLLDRRSGWLKGGNTEKAVVPGNPEASLLIRAVKYGDDNLQMPPEYELDAEDVQLLEQWIRRGAPGPVNDLGESQFSRLGDQDYLFQQAEKHWAFQPVQTVEPPPVTEPAWNRHPIDRFIFAKLAAKQLAPSPLADPRTLMRRLAYDLTGMPPTPEMVREFVTRSERERETAFTEVAERLLDSPAFGEHFARMWLDVARYADTDSFYRPDTRTPHYFPFAFTYRDYVIAAFNADKPYDQFVREQLAADLMDFDESAPELAALGFLTVGPHANRNPQEALDDWIDVTTRGLMGITAACARCHDHKFEPVPTQDYYSLRGVFASIVRPHPLREDQFPLLAGYDANENDRADYQRQRKVIDGKISGAGNKTSGGNQRSIAQKIRETELAELLLFHPGAPVHTMIVKELPRPQTSFVFVRGDAAARGDSVPRRFLKVLDPEQTSFTDENSGRLELAEKIVSPRNPLTARVYVNRVWGYLMGSYLVSTPSDFGLQGEKPSHPQLLDWLTSDFMAHGWSTKWLVRTIILSRTYAQSSRNRPDAMETDPENRFLWRANRSRLSIEALRDSCLTVANRLDDTRFGRPQPLWGENYTRRRAIYGYVNRFNLDPTLRVFDFPTPMQSHPKRDESIVAPQALFTLNSPFVIDQAAAITQRPEFVNRETDGERIAALFNIILQREPVPQEVDRIHRFVGQQQRYFKAATKDAAISSPWPLVAQSLLMSNEFQYVD